MITLKPVKMKIEALKELTNILNGSLSKKHTTFNHLLAMDTGLVAKLFAAIRQNKVTNDQEARNFLYRNCTAEDSAKFRNLKSRLQELLFTSILIENKGGGSNHRNEALNECYAKLHIIQTLEKSKARCAIQDIARSTFSLAEKFDLTEIALPVSEILKKEASFNLDEKHFECYKQKTEALQATLNAEIEAEHHLETFQVKLKNSAFVNPALINEVNATTRYLDQDFSNISSFNFNTKSLKIKTINHQLKGRYKQVLNNTSKFIQWLKNEPKFYQSTLHGELLVEQIKACYGANQIDHIDALNATVENILQSDTNVWFDWKETQILIAFQRGAFEEAEQIIHDIHSNEAFTEKAPLIQEKWQLYEAMLHIVNGLKGKTCNSQDQHPENFKLYKFLNEIPKISKDKKGYNIAVFITEMLTLLLKKEWTKISERSEALHTYSKRYLKAPQHHRSKLFCRMLLTIERQGFDYEKAFQKTLPLLRKLRKHPGSKNLMYINAEFIPYETLWLHVLRFLKNHD